MRRSASRRLLWIDPQDVRYCTPASEWTDVNQHEARLDHPHAFHDRGYFHEAQRRGTVMPGDWDGATLAFQDLLEFTALRDHIAGAIPWHRSAFAERSRRWIDSGETSRGYGRSSEFLAGRLEEIESLIRSIERHGVNPAAGAGSQYCTDDDISVNVGRDGRILFNNRGHHRLAIAKILHVPLVPVQIIVWHSESRTPEHVKLG